MRQLTILSGKGGTGKTSLTAAFASLAAPVVLADCDVDAADLHLVCRPTPREQEPFRCGHDLAFDAARCTGCGRCAEVCRFEAVSFASAAAAAGPRKPTFDPFACEGCGCCVDGCVAGALTLVEATAGELMVGDTARGPLIHARLRPGAENSGKLVAAVRQRARGLAERDGIDLVLADGPPGVGCPVIASLSGADGVLAVTEPSVSALHDLARVLDLAEHFRIPAAVLVNKCDLSAELTGRIEDLCRQRRVAVVGRLPFDRAFVDSLVAGRGILESPACPVALRSRIQEAWQATAETVEAVRP